MDPSEPPPAVGVRPAFCRNHPQAATAAACAYCRGAYCDQCLVEFRGVLLCEGCKEIALAGLRSSVGSVEPTTVVTWARVYDWLMAVGSLAGLGLQIWGLLMMNDVLAGSGGGVGFSMRWLGFWSVVPAIVALVASVPPAVGLGPGRRWAYWWQTVMLVPSALLSCMWASCLGLLFWPGAVILLVFMLKPEVRAYCGADGP